MPNNPIIVIGGGYAGLAALGAVSGCIRGRTALLFDSQDYHTVKTRLYESAVSSDRNFLINLPLKTFADMHRAEFIRERVDEINFGNRRVIAGGSSYEYDSLLVAPGGEANYFGIEGAAENAQALTDSKGAAKCARRVTELRIGKGGSPARRIVVCGGGLAGIEVAAMLRQSYPDKRRLQIALVEKMDRIMGASQGNEAQRAHVSGWFYKNAIEIRTSTTVTKITASGVETETGGNIEADMVYWCSGVKRADVGGVEKGKRFIVGDTLQLSDQPGVFSTGDFTFVESKRRFANLMSAQRAIYQGRIAGVNISRYLQGLQLRKSRYQPFGELIALGDFDGAGTVRGTPVFGAVCSALKKANELKYLAQLYESAPALMKKISPTM
ncbi:MAG: FAD-dependent oxidoreductase [bacterium]